MFNRCLGRKPTTHRMKRRITGGLHRFLQSEDGAHGAEHALLTGAIACALVLGASYFWKELASALADLSCKTSAACAMRVESVARPAIGGAPSDATAGETTTVVRHAGSKGPATEAPRRQ